MFFSRKAKEVTFFRLKLITLQKSYHHIPVYFLLYIRFYLQNHWNDSRIIICCLFHLKGGTSLIFQVKKTLSSIKLIHQIALGLFVGIVLAILSPTAAAPLKIFGDLFVTSLKSVAPVLVFFLVMNAVSTKKPKSNSDMRPIMLLYLTSTFLASFVGVFYSFVFPTTLHLENTAEVGSSAPGGIGDVLLNLILSIIDNPLHAIVSANYISILVWAIILGLALKNLGGDKIKEVLDDFSKAITIIVSWVIRFAPLGIMGLVSGSIVSSGISALLSYVQLLALLIAGYATVALVVNPIIVFCKLRRNPYPLVWTTLKESGLYAFFTRSSAANIPVNLSLCERMGLDPDTYTISIPLGAAINTAGASVTISIFALATAHTLGIHIDMGTAFLLSLISAIGACGSSGVAGGSLLLIPIACSSFGIGNDISMQVVGIGFIVSVLEDSCETALNSSSDVLFTATSLLAQGKGIPLE